MKHQLLIIASLAISLTGIAQGKSQGKGNGHKVKSEKVKVKTTGNDHDEINHGNHSTTHSKTSKNHPAKTSKNQPTKVKAAFQSDYPDATNVVWSKYRGDWTATFNSGLGRSTAVYHANGVRKDTRTPITRSQLPNGSIWDRIFRRDGVNPSANIVQIQSPSLRSEIFRIASQRAGSRLQYLFYNSNGQKVQYNY